MVMLGSVMVGQGAPCIEALAAARGVGYTIFNIIERVRISLFCYTLTRV
jgi:isopentenyl diphosphate isomerase/L-lactate dehydrogenase-like FMN-dependent dehydrogenase